jgi:hypothetical protein
VAPFLLCLSPVGEKAEKNMSNTNTLDQAYKRVVKMMRGSEMPNMNRLPGKVRVPMREVQPGTRPIMVVEIG